MTNLSTPAEAIRTAAAAYVSEPTDMHLIALKEAWNANVDEVDHETLTEIAGSAAGHDYEVTIADHLTDMLGPGYICATGDEVLAWTWDIDGHRREMGIYTHEDLQIHHESRTARSPARSVTRREIQNG